MDLLLEGYDHILDQVVEEDIVQETIKRGHAMTLSLLQSIPTFEVSYHETVDIFCSFKLASDLLRSDGVYTGS